MKKQLKKEYLLLGNIINPPPNPQSLSDQKIVDLDADLILSLLKQNKVPLVALDKKLWDSYPELFKTPQFTAAYSAEKTLFTNLRDEWAKVRDQFVNAGIETILIKSVGFFPYTSDNLDVLIKESERERAQTILKDMGYIELKNIEEPYKTLFRKFSGGKSVSVIHLHNKVAWVNPFHEEKFLWERYSRSSLDDLVGIPSPEDSILILTAHWFYEDKETTLSDIMKISSCLKEDNLDWHYMTTVANKMGWLNGFYYALLIHSFVEKHLYGTTSIQESLLEEMEKKLPLWMRTYLSKSIYSRSLSLPFKLPKILGKFLHFVKTVKDQTITPVRKFYELYIVTSAAFYQYLFSRFRTNLRYQPRMLISLSGVDGSGKSTYAETLLDIFTFCEFRTRFVWSRVGSSNFLKPFSKTAKALFGLKKDTNSTCNPNKKTAPEARGKDFFKESTLLRITGLSLLLVEMLWQYFFKVALPLFTKQVVICDRYIYDTLADIEAEYGVPPDNICSKFFRKMLTSLTPKPDIAYLLKVTVKDACKRKEKENVNKQWFAKQIEVYQMLSTEFKLNEIDTSGGTPITDISDRMINECLTTFYRRWHT